MAWSPMKLVDMEMDDEDKYDLEAAMPAIQKPKYPYGLRICLNRPELEKLGLEPDCEVGDVIDLRAFAEVTSVSVNQMQGQPDDWRVELQIKQLAVENESEEGADDESAEG